MPLVFLHLGATKVTDLSALAGMPLKDLRLHGCTERIDLSPLADAATLKNLTIPRNVKDFEFLRALSKIEYLGYNEDKTTYRSDKTAAEFWKEFDQRA